jgi:RIO kinase 2
MDDALNAWANLHTLPSGAIRLLLLAESKCKIFGSIKKSTLKYLYEKHSKENKKFEDFLNLLFESKLVAWESRNKELIRLTFSGYDLLALRSIDKKFNITFFGSNIARGKESDLYVAECSSIGSCVIKFYRIGRTSFRDIRRKRSFSKLSPSWLVHSTKAAASEARAYELLKNSEANVPKFFWRNRHALVLEYIEGKRLSSLEELELDTGLFYQVVLQVKHMLKTKFVHVDLNPFNILVSNDRKKVYIIDFPQWVPLTHPNSLFYLSRDLNNVASFFKRKGVSLDGEKVINDTLNLAKQLIESE